MALICTHCGVSSEPGASFYTQCGRPLEEGVPVEDWNTVVALRNDIEGMIERWVKAHAESWPSPDQQWGPRDLANNLAEGLRGSWDFARRVIR